MVLWVVGFWVLGFEFLSFWSFLGGGFFELGFSDLLIFVFLGLMLLIFGFLGLGFFDEFFVIFSFSFDNFYPKFYRNYCKLPKT